MSLEASFTPMGNTVLLTANSAAPLGILPTISTGIGAFQYQIVNSGSQTAYLTYASDAATAQSLASAYVPAAVYPPSFFAPLKSNLTLTAGTGSATFTRATSATCFGYKETDGPNAAQSMLTIPAGVPRFSGARFVASTNSWSPNFYDGTPIPDSTLLGYLSEGAATNFFLNSGAPATQTISLGAGTYTTWLTGTGSITTSAGTATATGYGAASSATPNTITVTGAGTVVFTVAGTVTIAQVENNAFPSSYIATLGAPVTRNADLLGYGTSIVNADTELTISLTAQLNSVGTGDFPTFVGKRAWVSGTEVGFAVSYASSTRIIGAHFADGTNGIDVLTAATPNVTVPLNTRFKIGIALRKGTVNVATESLSGSAVSTAVGTAITGSVANTVSNLAIGNDNGGIRYIFGNIRDLSIRQNSLDNSILRYVTGNNIPAGVAIPVMPNTSAIYSMPPNSYFSAITALPGAANLYITPGDGI